VKFDVTSRLGGLGLSILACGAAILVILWGSLLLDSAEQRSLRLGQAGRDTANLAIAFREHISRTLTALDQIMLAIKAEHEADPARFELPQWLEHSSFLAGLATQVSLVDAKGRVRVSNLGLAASPVDTADRPHFRYHLDPAAPQPYISVPVLGRLSGKWSIQVTRRLDLPDGSFGGTVVISIDPLYLGQFFETIDLGPSGVATLVGRDGIVRARRAGAENEIGQDMSRGKWHTVLDSAGHGTFISQSAIDGVERIRSAMAVPGFPLVVIVGLGLHDVLSGLDAELQRRQLIGAALTVVLILLVALLLREVVRRYRRESALGEQAAVMSTLLDVTPAAIAVKDEKGRYLLINEAMERQFGRRRSEIIGRTNADLMPPESVQQIVDWDVAARQAPTQLISGERSLVIDGQQHHYLSQRRACEIGGRVVVIAASTDITAIRQGERALERAAAAEAASRIKSEFLANMSHELRTPLNAILGFSEVMERELYGALGDPRYRGYAADIHLAGTHLLDVVNDILDLTKAEAGAMAIECQPTEIAPVVEMVRRIVQDSATELGLALDIAVPAGLVARADAGRLRQVLLNLISNALKFTPGGGRIAITAVESEDGIWISVADTGIGIATAEIPIALAPFGQIESSQARRHEGTGLGLPLAKRLIEMMGGAFTLDSELGKGTSISFSLPRVVAQAAHAQAAPAEAAAAEDAKQAASA
jgi:PAS domain S-box-containing protein